MLNVHITTLTDEELDAVAAGAVTITRNYSAAGATSSITSDIKSSDVTITVLGAKIESVTLVENTKITST
jgi:hypothetical protein